MKLEKRRNRAPSKRVETEQKLGQISNAGRSGAPFRAPEQWKSTSIGLEPSVSPKLRGSSPGRPRRVAGRRTTIFPRPSLLELAQASSGSLFWYMDTIIVDQGRSSMYGFVEPQTIQPSGNTLESQLVQVLYPKVCNKHLDSWECGFYVMSWIKTIIRATITDDWNESTSPIPGDTIKQIRQEWTTYLLQRWS
ncbi:hypothetical protein LR48_Vigan02g099800 [Vigna angularis]|uniref:Ubiquitin-like protease family profile domain-containing protein n=1 Tax=Phaseolus angularis TaxID=3914 RepID=A0A0L9TW84_PHAAN|nr:hypothetical protein LR48_Vigan02g099800 [Vigna angularis]